jgi:hypothetical protein
VPVHDIRYRPYEGALLPTWARLSAVPRYGLMAVFNKHLGIALFGLGSIYTILLGVYLYVTNSPALQAIPMWSNFPKFPPERLFSTLLYIQSFVCLGVLLLSAPRMLSPELRHKALPLVYSRPVTRPTYILGKLSTLLLLTWFLTIGHTLIVTLLMVSFYDGSSPFMAEFFSKSVFTILNAVFCGAAIGGTFSVVALACSAATKNPVFAGVGFLIVFAGSSAFSAAAGALFKTERWYFGLMDTTFDLTRLLLDGTSSRSIGMILLGISTWWVVSLGFLALRMRPVEVYSE